MTAIEPVYDQLDEITDPCSTATGSNLSIVEMGLVKGVEVADGTVTVEMRLTSPMCHMVPYFIEQVEERVGDIDGIETVALETDSGHEWTPDMMSEAAQAKRQAAFDSLAEQYRDELPFEVDSEQLGTSET